MCLYLQHLYDSGQSFHLAACTVFGLQHKVPWMANHLNGSKLALKGWNRSAPSTSHPPLTWELTCLLSVWMLLHDEPDVALAMLVGFDCYLRIGELINLTVQDVAKANDPRIGAAYRGVMLRLAKTKTGNNQAVTVENGVVASLLQRRIQGRRSDEKVFAISREHFYSVMHKACSALGLGDHGYTPHSLRHGGATRHYLQGKPITDIQFRGRWSNAKSVRTYIQSGRALLLLTKVNPDTFSLGQDCTRLLRVLFNHVLKW
jgi:integrase